MDALPSLTQDEARRRAELLAVDRYEIAVDLTGLLDGDAFRAVTTIRFSCREPGATTFVECAADVESAVLNGAELSGATGPRVDLPDLQADNVLVVTSVQRDTGSRTGVHRSVDASDGNVYVWTSFEPDEARRAWACFDQPDLKAVLALTVDAPASWMVLTSTTATEVVEVDGGRRWTFADTPRLSTYVPALNAGPFHGVTKTVDGRELGLYSRVSLAASLDRDAEDLFGHTAAGLAFFGEQFAMPYPESRYDQVFVPDLGGAMENYGCVTWSDAFLYRTPPSPGERELRTAVLLHEMAHMWFGDIVTMRWWDDLWLNEAFAEWACHWAGAAATEFTDMWASFLADWKLGGYSADRAPSRHPIRQVADDVASAAANFDNITYAKGASVLKQLVAYVGQDSFVAALRSYFGKHAWGNATLLDLMGEIEAASGRDLKEWTRTWLETAGTDTLVLTDGLLRAEGPDGTPPRPHRVDVGRYHRDGDGFGAPDVLELEVAGEPVAVEPADLVLVNDNDLTFAVVRPDEAGRSQLLAGAADLPTAVGRTVAVTSAWQLLVLGDIDAAAFVECATKVLAAETAEAVVEPVLELLVQAADLWSPDARREELMSAVADACIAMAQSPARRVAATRALAQTATTDEQLTALEQLVEGDVDLRWRRLVRLAALGRVDLVEAAALAAEDPDPDVWVRELIVRAAQPDAGAKEETWEAVLSGTKVPLGRTYSVARAFWQRSQSELLAPYAERFLTSLDEVGSGGMIPAMSAAGGLFPRVGVDLAFLDRLTAAVRAPGINPIVTHTVVERSDELRRMLAARG